jgi:hypothetical protein
VSTALTASGAPPAPWGRPGAWWGFSRHPLSRGPMRQTAKVQAMSERQYVRATTPKVVQSGECVSELGKQRIQDRSKTIPAPLPQRKRNKLV